MSKNPKCEPAAQEWLLWCSKVRAQCTCHHCHAHKTSCINHQSLDTIIWRERYMKCTCSWGTRFFKKVTSEVTQRFWIPYGSWWLWTQYALTFTQPLKKLSIGWLKQLWGHIREHHIKNNRYNIFTSPQREHAKYTEQVNDDNIM